LPNIGSTPFSEATFLDLAKVAERDTLRQKITPLVSKVRALVRYFFQHEDKYVDLETDAKESGVAFYAFEAETPTRWNGFLRMAISVLRNERALAIFVAKRGNPPDLRLLTADEGAELKELCAVLKPLEAATKVLEGQAPKALGSVYLPTLEGLGVSLRSPNLSLPDELKTDREPSLRSADLRDTPKLVRSWLAADLVRIRPLKGGKRVCQTRAADFGCPIKRENTQT